MTYQEWRHAHAFRIPQKALETLDRIMVGQSDQIAAAEEENGRLRDALNDALGNLNDLCDMKNAEIADLRAELAKPEPKPFFQFRECEDSQAGQPAPFKQLGTVYRWTALKDGKLVYQYGEDGYPQLFAKTAVKLPESPEPAQEPLTDAEIEDCMKKAYATLGKSRNLEHVFARTIEAAHGIGGKA
jgi:hypothetical protein